MAHFLFLDQSNVTKIKAARAAPRFFNKAKKIIVLVGFNKGIILHHYKVVNMKKYILSFLAAITLALPAFAQSWTTQHGDTVSAQYTTPGDISVENLVKSVSGTIYLKWKIADRNFPANWSLTGFCDNNTCYNVTVTPGLLNGSYQLSSGYTNTQYGDFHAIFNGNNAAVGSQAWIKVYAIDTEANYARNIVFIATKWATGITTVSKVDDGVTLYPNPAVNSVNVLFDAAQNIRNIAVYNLIGKAVKVFKVTGNSAKLDINDIPSGIYFVRLINAQGQIVATRKFTHQ